MQLSYLADADDIARISKQKWTEFKGRIGNLKGDLPVIVTTNEGIPVVTTPNKLKEKSSRSQIRSIIDKFFLKRPL